jgi:hypothetical protein
MPRLQISARLIQWPDRCACCHEWADSKLYCAYTRTTGQRVIRHDSRGWDIPYCKRCLAHLRENRSTRAACNQRLAVVGVAFCIVLFLGGAQYAIASMVGALLVGVGVGFLYLGRMKKMQAAMSEHCRVLDEAAAYRGWEGTIHSFWFASADFAEAVRDCNRSKCLD